MKEGQERRKPDTAQQTNQRRYKLRKIKLKSRGLRSERKNCGVLCPDPVTVSILGLSLCVMCSDICIMQI